MGQLVLKAENRLIGVGAACLYPSSPFLDLDLYPSRDVCLCPSRDPCLCLYHAFLTRNGTHHHTSSTRSDACPLTDNSLRPVCCGADPCLCPVHDAYLDLDLDPFPSSSHPHHTDM